MSEFIFLRNENAFQSWVKKEVIIDNRENPKKYPCFAFLTNFDSYTEEIEFFYHDDFIKMLEQLNDEPHDSDCSMHNEPAYPNGECDCSVKEGK